MSVLIGPRTAAALAVAFALFLFLGVASIDVPLSVSDQELVDWWSKSSNQTAAIASMYFVAISAIAFIPFLSHFRDRLNQDGGNAGTGVFALGLAFATLLLASAATRGVIGTAVQLNDEPLPGADTLRYLPQLAYAVMNIALLTAGSCLLLGSLATLRTKALPAWFGWASAFVGAVLLIGTPLVGPLTLPALWLWAIAAGVAVWSPAIHRQQRALAVG